MRGGAHRPDLEALGLKAQPGPVLGVRVENLVAKEALLASEPDLYFTTPHFNGYPAVLVHLDKIGLEELEELAIDAWLARAPTKVAKAFLATR